MPLSLLCFSVSFSFFLYFFCCSKGSIYLSSTLFSGTAAAASIVVIVSVVVVVVVAVAIVGVDDVILSAFILVQLLSLYSFILAFSRTVLLALVAVPRACKLQGLDEAEWWGQAGRAVGFGLLSSFVVLDGLRVLAIFFTGPSHCPLLLRIRNPRTRYAVRMVAQCLSVPLGLFI